MKKIPVKSILSVGLSLVIVVGILLVLFTASDGSTLETPTHRNHHAYRGYHRQQP